jgi:cytochrome b
MAKYIAVWDPLIRIGHWTIVLAFAVAYLSGEDLLTVHVWAGYIVGAVVLIRVIWGFVGPSRARFTDFVYAPRAVLVYVGTLFGLAPHVISGTAPRVERWSSLCW